MKKEQESFSKTANAHGLPDITMDTIDLNNLISETQKKLDSFKNGFKTDSILDSSINELKNTRQGFPDSCLSEMTKTTVGIQDSSVSEIKKTEIISSSTMSESKIFETSNIMSEKSVEKFGSESTGLEKGTESVVSKQVS